MQGYFTLEESAELLGMSPNDLKQMARKGEIRSFQDRGTWRFRKQDIEEMARRRTDGSDLELAAQKQLTPRPTDSPAPHSPKPQTQENEVFNFSLAPEDEGAGQAEDDANVNIAADIHPGRSSGASSSGGKKSGSGRRPPGTDSDVRLVADGSDLGLKAPGDSGLKLAGDSGPKSSGPRSSKTNIASPKSPKPGKGKGDSGVIDQVDSGVRLVPIDSDSDVRIVGADSDDSHVPVGERPPKGATDSDIRLEGMMPIARTGVSDPPLTEEINLDEELQKEEARRKEQKPHGKKPAEPAFPTKSPFELSTSDLNLTPIKEEVEGGKEGSSDFDLTPAGESSSPLELGSDDFKLQDEMTLADDDASSLKGPQSGINLEHPADSGISLEQEGHPESESEFELTLDAETTPKPGGSKPPLKVADEADSDSSEFELSLDVDASAPSDSDSEFELTLDDTSAMEVAAVEEDGQEKDIFETDFEVPALDDESGSEAVAVEDSDTALESSEFELEIGDEDVAAMDDSGSEVVALDDEELEAPAPRRGKKNATMAADEGLAELEFDAGEGEGEGEGEPGLDIEEEAVAEDEVEEEEFATTAVAQQAPWGIFPVAVLLPCVIVMMFLGMLGLEHVQAQQGFKPGLLTKAIGGLMGDKK